MFRLLFRLTGILALAAAFVALVLDGTRSLAANDVLIGRFGEHLAQLLGARFANIQPVVERYLGARAWDIIQAWIFGMPTAAVLAAAGTILLLLTSKRSEPVGFAARL